ncbi:MAG: acetoin utilization protein acuB [Bacteroidetes bacterium HGW-Bacteroidetes-13]|nr:MAG: acetoin utilization protein acuB [Bacteroidetes bacterium HGW-Bacteroidetes-13]
MKITDFINTDIKPLTLKNTLKQAKDSFKKNEANHLAVIDTHLLGMLSKEDIHDLDLAKNIEDYQYLLDLFYVKNSYNWLEVLGLFAQNQTDLMPIVDDENQYKGCYLLEDLLNFIYETPFLTEPGNILIIEHNTTDYSMSKICQIVESNDGKLLGAFISESNPDTVQITLKIGPIAINPIIQSFRRYGYQIVSEHEEDKLMSNLKDRSDYLNRYLNI